MARRPRKTGFEHLLEALARLPWQVCLVLAPATWFVFHLLAEVKPGPTQGVSQLGSMAGMMVFKGAAMFLQYLAPMALLLAGLSSWLSKRRRTKLLFETEARTSNAPLHQLSWREFEQLVGAYFEQLGYAVNFTPDGADGGVDVIARKGSEVFLIQCKQWRSTQVGVSVVRELFGVMAANGATGAYVVSIGAFTNDAKAFADGRNIELVDAHRLLRPKKSTQLSTPAAATPASVTSQPTNPACPKCGATMVRRTAKQGANKGSAFYGCSTYPQCRGTLPA